MSQCLLLVIGRNLSQWLGDYGSPERTSVGAKVSLWEIQKELVMSEVVLPGFEMSVQVTANNCFSLPCMEEETVWIFNIIDMGL